MHNGSKSNATSIKIGKRHASLDVLVPPPNQHIFQAKASLPTNMLPVNLIASQGSLVNQPTEMAIVTNHMPESQSYSSINMMNKKALIIAKN